jgi:Ca2+-binding RTX toxin-like protein
MATIVNGTPNADVINITTNTVEEIYGGDGNDRINAGPGNDTIYGQNGLDVLTGDAGNDVIYGGAGTDAIYGGGNDDRLYGEAGNDTMAGDAGNDIIDGGAGNDNINAGLGNDTMIHTVGNGSDILVGGGGNDTVRIEMTSAQLTAEVRADLAALQDWMDQQLASAGSTSALFSQTTGATLTLNAIGLTLSTFEQATIVVDGTVVPLETLLNAAPITEAVVSLSTAEDTAIGGQIVATDPDGDALSWSLVEGPSNGILELDVTNGIYTFTPTENFSGADSFLVAITDASGQTVQQRVDVNVIASADAPTVAANGQTVVLSELIVGSDSGEPMAGDRGADQISGGDGNDVIDGDAGVVREIALDVTAALTDLDGSETLSVRILDLPLDAVLSAGTQNADGSWSLASGDLAGLTLTTSANTDFALTIEATALEPNGSAAMTTTSLSVTFDPGINGAGNDTLSGEAGNDVVLGNVGDDVIDGGMGDDLLEGGAGHDLLIHRLGEGRDEIRGGEGIDTIRIELTSAQLTSDVRADLAALDAWLKEQAVVAGSEAAQADQSDGPALPLSALGLTASTFEQVTIVLDGQIVPLASLLNSAPEADAEVTQTAVEDTILTGQLTASDANGDALAWSLVEGPANGTVLLAADGSYSYTPGANASGADSFTVRVTDEMGASVQQKVLLTVAGVADAASLQVKAVSVEVVGGDSSSAPMTIVGTAAADVLTGGAGNDRIIAGAGNDIINGDGGLAAPVDVVHTLALDISAALVDTDGSETLEVRVSGLPSDATLSAGTDNGDGSWTLSPADLAGLTLTTAATSNFTLAVDAISTEASGDVSSVTTTLPVSFSVIGGVSTGAGNDIIDDGAGNDTAFGGAGNDTFIAGEGDDRYSGGEGFDTIDFSAATSAVRVDLLEGRAFGMGSDTVSGIEAVIGSAHGDRIRAGDSGSQIDGGAGRDHITGGNGADTVQGGDGEDWIRTGKGDDVIRDGAGNDEVRAGAGNDIIINGAGNDEVRAGSGNDHITDGAGNDDYRGGKGNDTFVATAGNDDYHGGSGFDTLDFSAATTALNIDVDRKSITGFGDVRIESIESIIGGQAGDTFRGDNGRDVFDGGAGNDVIRGRDGADTLTGGSGNDTFVWMRDDLDGHCHGHGNGRNVDTITDFSAGDKLDLRDFTKGVKVSSLDSIVQLKDGAEGTMLSVKVGKSFVDVAFLDDVHETSAASMLAKGMILA